MATASSFFFSWADKNSKFSSIEGKVYLEILSRPEKCKMFRICGKNNGYRDFLYLQEFLIIRVGNTVACHQGELDDNPCIHYPKTSYQATSVVAQEKYICKCIIASKIPPVMKKKAEIACSLLKRKNSFITTSTSQLGNFEKKISCLHSMELYIYF